MFPLAKTWPCPLKSDYQDGKEGSDPLEGPIQIQVCFHICAPGRSLGPESEAKGNGGLAVLLRILKNGYLFAPIFKRPECFQPDSMWLQVPSIPISVFFVGLNFSRLHYSHSEAFPLLWACVQTSAKSHHH